MGFAHGALFPNETTAFFTSVYDWFEEQAQGDLPKSWPVWFKDLVVEVGLDVALDALVAAGELIPLS
jgi:hypothetical protein